MLFRSGLGVDGVSYGLVVGFGNYINRPFVTGSCARSLCSKPRALSRGFRCVVSRWGPPALTAQALQPALPPTLPGNPTLAYFMQHISFFCVFMLFFCFYIVCSPPCAHTSLRQMDHCCTKACAHHPRRAVVTIPNYHFTIFDLSTPGLVGSSIAETFRCTECQIGRAHV